MKKAKRKTMFADVQTPETWRLRKFRVPQDKKRGQTAALHRTSTSAGA